MLKKTLLIATMVIMPFTAMAAIEEHTGVVTDFVIEPNSGTHIVAIKNDGEWLTLRFDHPQFSEIFSMLQYAISRKLTVEIRTDNQKHTVSSRDDVHSIRLRELNN